MSRVLSLSALLLFLVPCYAPAETPAQSLRDYVVQGANRTAYGIYVGNKKAGWEVDEVKLGKHDDKEVAVETSQSYMAVNVDGTKTVLEQKEIDYYALEGEGFVVFSELRVIEDGQETVRTAVRKGDGMVQTIQVGDRKTERQVADSQGHARVGTAAGGVAADGEEGRYVRQLDDFLGPGRYRREGNLHLQGEETNRVGRSSDRGVRRPDAVAGRQVGRGTAGRRPAAARQGRRHGDADGKGGRRQETRRERRSDGGDLHQSGQVARPGLPDREADAGADRAGRFRPAGSAAAADRVAQGRRRSPGAVARPPHGQAGAAHGGGAQGVPQGDDQHAVGQRDDPQAGQGDCWRRKGPIEGGYASGAVGLQEPCARPTTPTRTTP